MSVVSPTLTYLLLPHTWTIQNNVFVYRFKLDQESRYMQRFKDLEWREMKVKGESDSTWYFNRTSELVACILYNQWQYYFKADVYPPIAIPLYLNSLKQWLLSTKAVQFVYWCHNDRAEPGTPADSWYAWNCPTVMTSIHNLHSLSGE